MLILEKNYFPYDVYQSLKLKPVLRKWYSCNNEILVLKEKYKQPMTNSGSIYSVSF